MAATGWLSVACILVALVALAALAWDRNVLRQRLDNAEGAVTGLTLDLAATRDKLLELQTYLSEHDSWELGAQPPARLADPSRPGRWERAGRDGRESTQAPVVSGTAEGKENPGGAEDPTSLASTTVDPTTQTF